jgi:hypothetical protein
MRSISDACAVGQNDSLCRGRAKEKLEQYNKRKAERAQKEAAVAAAAARAAPETAEPVDVTETA